MATPGLSVARAAQATATDAALSRPLPTMTDAWLAQLEADYAQALEQFLGAALPVTESSTTQEGATPAVAGPVSNQGGQTQSALPGRSPTDQPQDRERPVGAIVERSPQAARCLICDLWCNGRQQLQEHYNGKLHAKNLRRPPQARNLGARPKRLLPGLGGTQTGGGQGQTDGGRAHRPA